MNLTDQLAHLNQAVEHVSGRVPAETEAHARHVLAHAGRRLAAGPQTVVALGGATGSGKSSLFNAISGTRLAEQGARRPTTSKTLAVSFSATNPPLLDLLGVERRHEAEPPIPAFADVVLLDLPDHDSTSRVHRDEVDRMVGLVDQFVWVLDPQKYADAAIHRRYLQPLAGHREVITVVLNHADLLNPEARAQCLADVRRLLDSDGLTGVPLIATSALTGMGLEELRARLGLLAQSKKAAAQRLAADVDEVARELDQALGRIDVPAPGREVLDRVTVELSSAAGVPVVVDAVRDSVRHRGQLATGWPLVKWIGRLKPDPLRRLRLGEAKTQPELESAPVVERSSLPTRSAASSAHQSAALRTLVGAVGDPLPGPWRQGVVDALRAAEPGLPDELDRAVVTTDLRVARNPAWWQVIRALQWVLIAAVVVGLGWLTLNAVLGYLGLPPFANYPLGPEGGLQVPVPTALLLGGVLGGILTSGLSQLAINAAAGSSARRAQKALRSSVEAVAERSLVGPAMSQVQDYAAARAAIDRLL